MPASKKLSTALRKALRARANPEKAEGMRAYLKSEMPCLGVQTPRLREACADVFGKHPLATFEAWRDTVLTVWRDAAYREERHAAIGLSGFYDEYQLMKSLPMYEEMITTGAWWDLVDGIAPSRLGTLLKKYPTTMTKKMRTWSRSRDMWKRRSSIICQLKFKRDTDTALLFDCITESMTSDEFFLRKGIGWALREYAKTDPKAVIRFARKNKGQLSTLSKREGLKHVIKAGLLSEIP